MNFEEDVKNWVMIDNKIKQESENIKGLRKKRNHLTTKFLVMLKKIIWKML